MTELPRPTNLMTCRPHSEIPGRSVVIALPAGRQYCGDMSEEEKFYDSKAATCS